jgi:tetratricopeptide (TPR) repeat protein
MWRKCNLIGRRCVLAAAFAGLALVTAHGHGDVHEAIVMISKEIEAKPADAGLLCERALLYSQAEHYAEALADLAKADQLDPANDTPMAMRGRIFRSTGRLAEARAAQETFLKKHPAHVQVKFDYCRTLVDLKDTVAALRELDSLISTAKAPPPDAVALRLQLTEAKGPEGRVEALDWIKAFLSKHPLPVFEEHALGLEIELGRTADAVQRLDRLIATAPRPESWCLRKAELLSVSGDRAGAQSAARAAEEAIAKLPSHIRGSNACMALEQRVQKFLSPGEAP